MSFAPNDTTMRGLPAVLSRGGTSALTRAAVCGPVCPRTPRLYAVNGNLAAKPASVTRPTHPRAVGSPTPATNESPRKQIRVSGASTVTVPSRSATRCQHDASLWLRLRETVKEAAERCGGIKMSQVSSAFQLSDGVAAETGLNLLERCSVRVGSD